MADMRQKTSKGKINTERKRTEWIQQGTTIHALPRSVLQEIVTGRLEAKDLARLEASSSLFHVPIGLVPNEYKLSIAEAAAHHSCHMHEVFESFPTRAQSELLAKCNGRWKQVLHFLEGLRRSSGRCSTNTSHSRHNDVVATVGVNKILVVNRKEEIYIAGENKNDLCRLYLDVNQRPESMLKLISVQPTTNRILQISASIRHAALVTENGQVFSFGINDYCCYGVGSNWEKILKPTLVTDLEGIPCQQVMTGYSFTVALTKTGELYSWGLNEDGQLGHGNTCNEFRPRQIAMPITNNGILDPVVQVSTAFTHVVAVTKMGRLFTWGDGDGGKLGHSGCGNELRPKRVEHGGFADLFIVCGTAGSFHSAAIDSLGQVYMWGNHSHKSPHLIDSLRNKLAVQVVPTISSNIVLLDDGTIQSDMVQNGCFTIKGHKIQSIASGYDYGNDYGIVVTMKGAIFGLGNNWLNQFGIVGDVIPRSYAIPIEIFATVTGSK